MPWFDSEENATTFFDLLTPGAGEKILDVGAGAGRVADAVRTRGNSTVYAADPDKRRVGQMEARFPSLKSCLATSDDLPYPDASFDKAYSTLALHHFTDQRKSIQEFARVLKPMGSMLIVEIRPRSVQGRLLRLFENGLRRSHLNFLEMEELSETIKEQGSFEVKTMTARSSVYFVLSKKR